MEVADVTRQEQVAQLRFRCLDPSYTTGSAAVEALGKLGGVEAAVTLGELLDTVETGHLHAEICTALGETDTREALGALSRRVHSRDLRERESVIVGLARLRLPDSAPHLGVALRLVLAEIEPLGSAEGTVMAPDTLVRLESQGAIVIAALGQRVTLATSRALQDALQSYSAEIRMHAALALAEVAERDPDPRFVRITKLLQSDLPPWSFHLPRRYRGFREAVDRIRQAISAHGDRPIPSEPPEIDAGTLPLPTTPTEPPRPDV